jgi:2-phosphosulfolactate phosphatase
MTPTLSVYALPKYAEPEEMAGGTAVVIDVLRATTTVVYALAAGARDIIPCLEVADAVAQARRLPAYEKLLGGERQGKPIDGFDLGNSPEEYTAERVGGKTVVLTTTNGTRAMLHARHADETLIAAFVNASAVVRWLLSRQQIHIICAGTDGQISEDDMLLAGLLVVWFQRQRDDVYPQNDQAVMAREAWLSAVSFRHALGMEPLSAERLGSVLLETICGRKLALLGLEEDILAAAQLNRFDIVPRLDARTGRIVPVKT